MKRKRRKNSKIIDKEEQQAVVERRKDERRWQTSFCQWSASGQLYHCRHQHRQTQYRLIKWRKKEKRKNKTLESCQQEWHRTTCHNLNKTVVEFWVRLTFIGWVQPELCAIKLITNVTKTYLILTLRIFAIIRLMFHYTPTMIPTTYNKLRTEKTPSKSQLQSVRSKVHISKSDKLWQMSSFSSH